MFGLISAGAAPVFAAAPGVIVAPSNPVRGVGSLRVVLDASVAPEAYSGRVYIVLSKGEQEPRARMNDWFHPPQVFSKDVEGLAPGAEIALDDSWLGYPSAWADVPAGDYSVQAIVRKNPDSPTPGGPGDAMSKPAAIKLPLGEPGVAGPGTLHVAEVAAGEPFHETGRIKLVEMTSTCLSAFHGRDCTVRAGVLLPEDYKDDGSVSYPVVYSITGFGGDHTAISHMGMLVPKQAAAHVILVVPDPSCFRGHSVFADSENNGPWGQMLVQELAPEVEKRFHGAGAAQRYVTGVSSGGWSSLWLQVTYPDAFAGCWSHCPDPVDFRDFQQINLYDPGANMYKDAAGKRRPIARRGESVSLWYDDFCRREWVLGPGGQIGSFEAVFSPKLSDGSPAPVFDRQTGDVDTRVARTWEKYDIRLVLERGWKTLGPKLAGKIHVYAGGMDTFYLDGAARLLKQQLAKLGSDAVVEIVPGMPHTLHWPGNVAMFGTIMERAGLKAAPAAGGEPASRGGAGR